MATTSVDHATETLAASNAAAKAKDHPPVNTTKTVFSPVQTFVCGLCGKIYEGEGIKNSILGVEKPFCVPCYEQATEGVQEGL